LETYQTDRNWHVHGVLELLRSNNHQLFAAFNYVTREFGAEMVEDNEEESHLGPSERWDRTQIAFSYRFQQMLNGDTRDEVTAYVFYNRIQNRMEFATEEDFVRIQADTGGAGLTWTRVRISRGDQISLNFFIEAGQLQRRPRHEDETEIDPLFRTGLGFEYTQLRGRSGTPRTFGMDVSLEHGNWMSIPFPGDNVDPNMFGPFMEDALINGDPSAWTFMINARLNW